MAGACHNVIVDDCDALVVGDTLKFLQVHLLHCYLGLLSSLDDIVVTW